MSRRQLMRRRVKQKLVKPALAKGQASFVKDENGELQVKYFTARARRHQWDEDLTAAEEADWNRREEYRRKSYAEQGLDYVAPSDELKKRWITDRRHTNWIRKQHSKDKNALRKSWDEYKAKYDGTTGVSWAEYGNQWLTEQLRSDKNIEKYFEEQEAEADAQEREREQMSRPRQRLGDQARSALQNPLVNAARQGLAGYANRQVPGAGSALNAAVDYVPDALNAADRFVTGDSDDDADLAMAADNMEQQLEEDERMMADQEQQDAIAEHDWHPNAPSMQNTRQGDPANDQPEMQAQGTNSTLGGQKFHIGGHAHTRKSRAYRAPGKGTIVFTKDHEVTLSNRNPLWKDRQFGASHSEELVLQDTVYEIPYYLKNFTMDQEDLVKLQSIASFARIKSIWFKIVSIRLNEAIAMGSNDNPRIRDKNPEDCIFQYKFGANNLLTRTAAWYTLENMPVENRARSNAGMQRYCANPKGQSQNPGTHESDHLPEVVFRVGTGNNQWSRPWMFEVVKEVLPWPDHITQNSINEHVEQDVVLHMKAYIKQKFGFTNYVAARHDDNETAIAHYGWRYLFDMDREFWDADYGHRLLSTRFGEEYGDTPWLRNCISGPFHNKQQGYEGAWQPYINYRQAAFHLEYLDKVKENWWKQPRMGLNPATYLETTLMHNTPWYHCMYDIKNDRNTGMPYGHKRFFLKHGFMDYDLQGEIFKHCSFRIKAGIEWEYIKFPHEVHLSLFNERVSNQVSSNDNYKMSKFRHSVKEKVLNMPTPNVGMKDFVSGPQMWHFRMRLAQPVPGTDSHHLYYLRDEDAIKANPEMDKGLWNRHFYNYITNCPIDGLAETELAHEDAVRMGNYFREDNYEIGNLPHYYDRDTWGEHLHWYSLSTLVPDGTTQPDHEDEPSRKKVKIDAM